jgi:KaiC/GvpD/RAD55 family RecA-like ATPase
MRDESDRTTTGVLGFDESLQGGYPKGKVILEGPSSEERNALSLSFAAEGLKNDEYVMIVTSTISPTKVRMVLRKLGVDVKEYERKGMLIIIDWYSHNTSPVAEIEEIGAVIKCPGDNLNLNEAFHRAHSKFPKDSKHRAVVDGLSYIIGNHNLDTALLLANSIDSTFGDDQSTVLFVVDSEMHDSTTISGLERGFDGRLELKRIKGEGSVIGEISIHSMKDTTVSQDSLILERAEDKTLRIEGSGVQTRELPAEKEMAELVDSLQEDSSNETTWFGLGIHYASEKKYDKAQECFDAALKIRPGYVAAWISKANLYIEQGENDDALRCYQHALNPEPDENGDGEDSEDSKDVQDDQDQNVCPECGNTVAATDPFCLSCGMDIPKETPIKKAKSVEEALAACERRIEASPEEADAWFVKGLCLARLKRYEDAVVALNEATRLNFEYPGLWIVKGKVYSKLGDEKKAALSIQRGIEFARKDVESVGPTFECSICGEDVNVKADQCSNCGARFKPLKDKTEPVEEAPQLGSELESILKRWETELSELAAPSEKAPPEAPGPSEEVAKRRARRKKAGLTNGLSRERRVAKIARKGGLTNGVRGRTNGLTNGLKGRTNGLTNGVKGRTNGLTNGVRGRTNGLTNGVRGRTNGLTNGVRGRTNGLTNGVRGRTNGLTNGVKGRTNGLTNGVRGRTNGLTNGLTNGVRGRTNGLTNGLKEEPRDLAPGQVNGLGRATGVTNGLAYDVGSLRVSLADGLTNGNGLTNGLGVNRFDRESKLAKWKLYLVPLFATALLFAPLFYAAETSSSERVYIDGEFSDWEKLNVVDMSPSGLNPSIDIIGASVEMSGSSLFLYLEVLGNILSGDLITETGDAVHILIDSDRNYATGYNARGLGADYYVEVTGIGGQIQLSRLWRFSVTEDQSNWNGWTDSVRIPSAVSFGQLEAKISREYLEDSAEAPLVLFHSQSWTGDYDLSDYVLSGSGVILSVLQRSALISETVQGFDQNLLNVEISAVEGQATMSSLDVEITGSIQTSEVSSLKLVDSQGQLLDEVFFYANPVTFQFDPIVMDGSSPTNLVVRADLSSGDERTIGARIPSSSSFGVEDAATTLTYVSSTYDMGYVNSVPQQVTIDGGFVDWANCTGLDETGEASTQGDTNIDIGCFDNTLDQGLLFTYFDVSGRILAGTDIPRRSPPIRQFPAGIERLGW